MVSDRAETGAGSNCGVTCQPERRYKAPMTDHLTRADRLHSILTGAFVPTVLQIQDDSARHAGHAGAQAGGQSHYTVLMVSAAFEGLNRVARSRAVHAALQSEFGPAEQGGLHALALTLRTPAEHAGRTGQS